VGIKVVSEMPAGRRALSIMGVIGMAWVALLAFALLPAPYRALALFVNGLPLGVVWGLVYAFLEGRRISELLGAGLSASYILASGVVKSAGKALLDAGVPEPWMPFATGGLFFLPMALFVGMLAVLPPPTAEDIAARVERPPMDSPARRAFLSRYAAGLVPLVLLYLLLTAFRDTRDSFAREIWDALGYADQPSIFSTAEIPVAVGAISALLLVSGIQDNRQALRRVFWMMGLGTASMALSTGAWQLGLIGPAAWMIGVGLGAYVAYVPYGCVLFDRMMPALGVVGTSGFLIYLADSTGYLSTVGILLVKNLMAVELSWLDFFVGLCWATSLVCTLCFAFSGWWFLREARRPS
jgi:hypothetical protein